MSDKKYLFLFIVTVAMFIVSKVYASPAEPLLTSGATDSELTIKEALTNGTLSLDARYRFEHADVKNSGKKNAKASTLRTNIGYKTGLYNGLQGDLQIQNVSVIGANELYNSSINNETNRETVADPEVTQINHANISYSGIKGVKAIIGRQAINLDNQRFVGTVGLRQNDQSYDAIVVNAKSNNFDITYGISNRVNTIFGSDSPKGNLEGSFHIANASYNYKPLGKISTYAYLLDSDSSSSQYLSDTQTFGTRLAGSPKITKTLNFTYALEYANQSDYADNATSFNARYYTYEAGLKLVALSA